VAVILTRPPSALVGADPAHFDPDVAHALAELAQIAYRPAGTARVESDAVGWPGCQSLQVGAGQLAVLWAPEAIVVSVRGSDQGADWPSNLRGIWRRGWSRLPPGCRVGMGWLGQAKAMLPEVARLLIFALSRHPTAPIFWVGHSAGGPIATVLCAALEVPAPRLVVTFSAPRGWNRRGAAWYDATYPQTWGVVPVIRGAPDAATRVPPKWSGAHHVGRRIMLVEGRALENLEDWRALEDSHPVGWLPSWRILSRVVAGIGIHPIGVTVGVLRRMAEAEDVTEREEIDR